MEVLDRGHRYRLKHRGAFPGIKPGTTTVIQFVNREKDRESEGTTTQECLRMLIDRTWYCNDCLPWQGNAHIVGHLRMALALHEVRAILRKVEKGELEPEFLQLGDDGHILLQRNPDAVPSDYARMPATGTDTGSLRPGVCSHHERKGEGFEELEQLTAPASPGPPPATPVALQERQKA